MKKTILLIIAFSLLLGILPLISAEVYDGCTMENLLVGPRDKVDQSNGIGFDDCVERKNIREEKGWLCTPCCMRTDISQEIYGGKGYYSTRCRFLENTQCFDSLECEKNFEKPDCNGVYSCSTFQCVYKCFNGTNYYSLDHVEDYVGISNENIGVLSEKKLGGIISYSKVDDLEKKFLFGLALFFLIIYILFKKKKG